jgi:hypothetical protein
MIFAKARGCNRFAVKRVHLGVKDVPPAHAFATAFKTADKTRCHHHHHGKKTDGCINHIYDAKNTVACAILCALSVSQTLPLHMQFKANALIPRPWWRYKDLKPHVSGAGKLYTQDLQAWLFAIFPAICVAALLTARKYIDAPIFPFLWIFVRPCCVCI